MKKLMVFAMAVCAMAGAFAAANEAMTKDVNVVVTSLSVRQRYPWNGKVDIDFSIDSEFPEAFSFVSLVRAISSALELNQYAPEFIS